ncbi:hypothetical protein BASA60_001536 [Batrachochytrium salamandrivorans]|nr:hypothetical protein BASA60_001536 [Batrachochytrium salamandrivorans]
MSNTNDNKARLRTNTTKDAAKSTDTSILKSKDASFSLLSQTSLPSTTASVSFTPGTRLAEFITATRACIRVIQALLYSYITTYVAYGSAATVHRGGAMDNTLLIIGDDFAAGVGDSATLGSVPGLARFLARELTKESKIKQTWSIFNCGIKDSTSADWLPLSEKDSSQTEPTYFEKLFEKPKYAKAQVIILMVGFNDSRIKSESTTQLEISPEQTMANIHGICKVLGNMGKDVFVCPVVNTGDSFVSDDLIEKNMRRNEMIFEYTCRGDKKHVFAGPKIDVFNYEYRVDRYYADDKIHFSDKIEFSKFAKALGLKLTA